MSNLFIANVVHGLRWRSLVQFKWKHKTHRRTTNHNVVKKKKKREGLIELSPVFARSSHVPPHLAHFLYREERGESVSPLQHLNFTHAGWLRFEDPHSPWHDEHACFRTLAVEKHKHIEETRGGNLHAPRQRGKEEGIKQMKTNTTALLQLSLHSGRSPHPGPHYWFIFFPAFWHLLFSFSALHRCHFTPTELSRGGLRECTACNVSKHTGAVIGLVLASWLDTQRHHMCRFVHIWSKK